MFGKTKQNTGHLDSIIGENMEITGSMKGKGNIRIDGIIEGNIDSTGDIVLGENGKIKGDISCTNITIGGSVNGNIITKEQLVLLSSGKLIGDVEVSNFVINEDALFEGSCKMKKINNNPKKENKNNKKAD